MANPVTFTAVPILGNAPLTVTFTNTTPAPWQADESVSLTFDNTYANSTGGLDAMPAGNVSAVTFSNIQVSQGFSQSVYLTGELNSAGIINCDLPISYDYGYNDWTLESWMYIDSFNAGGPNFFFGLNSGGMDDFSISTSQGPFGGQTLRFNAPSLGVSFTPSTWSNYGTANYSTPLTGMNGQWMHLAFVKQNTGIRFYVNGINVWQWDDALTLDTWAPTNLLIGDVYGSWPMNTYLNNTILTNAVKYVNDFTPSSPITGIINQLWDFGDGNTSSAVNPTHTYQTAGDFNATLQVEFASGGGTFLSGPTTITATTPTPPDITFTADPVAGPAPLTVTFTDTSTIEPTPLWIDTFNGSGTLATHVSNNGVTYHDLYPGDVNSVADCIVANNEVYLGNGKINDVIVVSSVVPPDTYTTEIVVRKAFGADSFRDYIYIFAMDDQDNWYGPQANILYAGGQWQVNLYVSSPSQSYSSEQVFTGNTDGYATPKLTLEVIGNSVFKLYFNDVLMATSTTFTDMPPLPVYGFDIHNTANNTPMYLQSVNAFIPTTIEARIWYFGDSTIGTQATETHTYTAAGNYQVTLANIINGVSYTSAATTIAVASTDNVSIAPIVNGTQFFDQSGQPLAGGKVFTYTANASTTKFDTFADQAAAVKNPNPLVLGSQGELTSNIWLKSGGNYNLVVTKPDGETVLESINGISTQRYIAGDHVRISPATGTGIVTISAEKPDPFLGHGFDNFFRLTNDVTGYFNDIAIGNQGEWNVETVLTTDTPEVEWDFATGAFKFNSAGCYTITIQAQLHPTNSNMPTDATVMGFIINDGNPNNLITKSYNPFYGYVYEGYTNDLPSEYQYATWLDVFTVSVAAGDIARPLVYGNSPSNVNVAYDIACDVFVAKFSDTRYTPIPDPQPSAVPVASFDYSPQTGPSPLAVEFFDTSTNSPTSWYWDFGDGNTSTEQNPFHTYQYAGTYTVTLSCSNVRGPSENTATGTVTPYDLVLPVASFTPPTTTGNTPVTVNFVDTSTGHPTSWYWDFGDGNTSTEQNPTHTYTTASLDPNNVSMNCSNNAGASLVPATGQVYVYGGINWNIRPVSSFTMFDTQYPYACVVEFTDTSTNDPDKWVWTINSPTDGTKVITRYKSIHGNGNIAYTTNVFDETYTVTLVASKQVLDDLGVNPTSATSYVLPTIQFKGIFSFAPNDPGYSFYAETSFQPTQAAAESEMQRILNAKGNLYVKQDMGSWYSEENYIGPFQLSAYSYYRQWASATRVGYNSYDGNSWTYYYGTNGQSTQVPGTWSIENKVIAVFS